MERSTPKPEHATNGHAPESALAEGRCRDLIEWLPAVIYEAEFGPEGQWYYVSPHIERLLGYSAQEMMDDPALFPGRLHPDDRDEVLELERTEADMARTSGVSLVSEYRLLHRDGQVIWVRDEARILRTGRAFPFWRGVLVDITQAREAERALAHAQERYRGLVSSLPVCAYEADPHSDNRRRFVSPQVRELIGYTPEEWEADPALWEFTLHPTDRSRVLRDEERHVTMGVGTPWVSEYRVLSRSGGVVWVRDRSVVAQAPDGRRVIDGILTDVTAEHAEAPASTQDVVRLSCASCGATHATDRPGPCPECGSDDAMAVSMNDLEAELNVTRARMEALLDGVHQHLETVAGSAERAVQATRSHSAVERRIITRPSGPSGG